MHPINLQLSFITWSLFCLVLLPFPADEQERKFTVAPGDSLKIECRAPYSVPKASFRWYRINSRTDPQPRRVIQSHRIIVTGDGTVNHYPNYTWFFLKWHIQINTAKPTLIFYYFHYFKFIDLKRIFLKILGSLVFVYVVPNDKGMYQCEVIAPFSLYW